MKILFLGEISQGQTSFMRMRALERLGHTVRGINTVEPWRDKSWLSRQLQRKLEAGTIVDIINQSVINAASEFYPQLVWAEKQEYLRADTIRKLKRAGARTAHYTPDPYFSLSWKRTRLMDEAILEFDALFYCKSYERRQYEALGKPITYLPLGYCDEVHRPLTSNESRWSCAVGFLGGWEPRREELLRAVVASGIDLKIWGGYWDFLRDGKWTLRRSIVLRQLAGGAHFKFRRDDLLMRAYEGGEVYGDEYACALTGAGIGLGFLRKAWPDQHTTRSFEIPACCSMLLADRTEEHRELFVEGSEAEFFEFAEELLDKASFYVNNELSRSKVAQGGHARCISSKYAYVHRMHYALGAMTGL